MPTRPWRSPTVAPREIRFRRRRMPSPSWCGPGRPAALRTKPESLCRPCNPSPRRCPPRLRPNPPSHPRLLPRFHPFLQRLPSRFHPFPPGSSSPPSPVDCATRSRRSTRAAVPPNSPRIACHPGRPVLRVARIGMKLHVVVSEQRGARRQQQSDLQRDQPAPIASIVRWMRVTDHGASQVGEGCMRTVQRLWIGMAARSRGNRCGRGRVSGCGTHPRIGAGGAPWGAAAQRRFLSCTSTGTPRDRRRKWLVQTTRSGLFSHLSGRLAGDPR